MVDILIKNATILNSKKRDSSKYDISIKDGIIYSVTLNNKEGAKLVIDAEGLLLTPGFIDLHVHLRDPGQTIKEDIITGCQAAAAGGFTSVVNMPNTDPTVDSVEVMQYIIDKSKHADVRVYQLASITKGIQGRELTDFREMKAAGVVGFSDDGMPVYSSEMLFDAMLKAKELGMPIFSHCEDLDYCGDRILNRGEVSEKLALEGAPKTAEDSGAARDLLLAMATGCKLHICHVTTETSINMIKAAKEAGVNVTAETAPHYFSMTEDELYTMDANYRMSPPLRDEAERHAVISGLSRGVLDVIATDHAPHAYEEKEDFLKAPNGVIGLETALGAGIKYLVKGGYMTIEKLIGLMTENPAKVLGINPGRIEEGYPADIAIFDENEHWTVNATKIKSKSKNSPYIGKELIGKVKYTICNGRLTYRDQ